MIVNGHDAKDFWPMLVVAGTALVGWGNLKARVAGVQKEIDAKASREVVERISISVDRIEEKLDRLIERG